MQTIKTEKVFLSEIEKATGKALTLPSLQVAEATEAPGAGPKAAASSTTTTKPESLDELRSTVHQVAKHGYAIGAHVVNKEAQEVQVFEVVALTEVSAVLLERGLVLTSSPESLTVSLHELTEAWKPFKGKVTCPLKGWTPAIGYPMASEDFCWEAIKGRVFTAMVKAHRDSSAGLEHLSLMQNPNLVVCHSEVKKGQLLIVATSMTVAKKHCNNGIALGQLQLPGSPHTFQAYLPKDPHTFKKEELAWASPFWMVQHDEEAPNLVMQFAQVEMDDFTIGIPVLVNKKKLPAMTILTVNREAKVKLAAAGSPIKRQRQS